MTAVSAARSESQEIEQTQMPRPKSATKVNVGDVERWASALGGIALIAYGISRRSKGGVALAVTGGGLMLRGTTGHCSVYRALGVSTAGDRSHPVHVEESVTISRSPEEVYRFWHNFENLPRFMKHLESVRVMDDNHSHWIAKAPAGRTVEWDAEITEDRENERIAWRSLGKTGIENVGSVRFASAPGGRGTEVHVSLEYAPPAGVVGVAIAKLFHEEPQQQVGEDLRRFKQLMESGEIATTDGQPSARVAVM